MHVRPRALQVRPDLHFYPGRQAKPEMDRSVPAVRIGAKITDAGRIMPKESRDGIHYCILFIQGHLGFESNAGDVLNTGQRSAVVPLELLPKSVNCFWPRRYLESPVIQ